MRWDCIKSNPWAAKAELLVLFLLEDELNKGALANKLKGILGDIFGKEFKAKKNETYLFPGLGKFKASKILLAGLGKRADLKADGLRQIAGVIAKRGRAAGAKNISVDAETLRRLPGDSAANFRAFAEGAVLGAYRYDKWKSEEKNGEPKKELSGITLLFESSAGLSAVKRALQDGVAVGEAVNFTRDLVNAPGNRMTPTMLAREAQRMSRGVKGGRIRCRVLGRQQIAKLGMNALLGVSRGSEEPPQFLILDYRGGKASEKPVLLVGKGITFDSGGISLKPAEGMDKMKYDMAGGAAVLGALRAAASLRLPVNVVGLVPTCENMPGGRATKPGDVVRAANGKTIEILNTDAEGRLILADALSYAARYKPRAAVDLATLTGACVVALGSQTCGMMGNDGKLIAALKEASARSSERAWELPLWDEYSECIKSDVADVKNIGNREAGAITAAAFLKKFVSGYPWVHLDIAGVAWEEGEKPYTPKGASGYGVRLLVALLEGWSKKR